MGNISYPTRFLSPDALIRTMASPILKKVHSNFLSHQRTTFKVIVIYECISLYVHVYVVAQEGQKGMLDS